MDQVRLSYAPRRRGQRHWFLRAVGDWETREHCPRKGEILKGIVFLKDGTISEDWCNVVVASKPTMLRYGADAGKWCVMCLKEKEAKSLQQDRIDAIRRMEF